MELALAILMVLGIYVGIPIVVVCAIGGVYALSGRLAQRARRVQAEMEAAEAAAETEAQRTASA